LSSEIARSPLGVAIGVLGAVHMHCAQPSGQVPLAVAGVQPMRDAPALTSQHSSPGLQQSASQQFSPAAQVEPWHGGLSHLPLLQYGFGPGHTVPHAPQLLMSLPVLMHSAPQHLKPQLGPQLAPPTPPPAPPPLMPAAPTPP
jgi:hypothetical protein